MSARWTEQIGLLRADQKFFRVFIDVTTILVQPIFSFLQGVVAIRENDENIEMCLARHDVVPFGGRSMRHSIGELRSWAFFRCRVILVTTIRAGAPWLAAGGVVFPMLLIWIPPPLWVKIGRAHV